jgi:hypothetical protein
MSTNEKVSRLIESSLSVGGWEEKKPGFYWEERLMLLLETNEQGSITLLATKTMHIMTVTKGRECEKTESTTQCC